MANPVHVVTHNGPFHADDVLAYALIRAFVDADATVERSREPAAWKAADLVIDVGGKYDPERGRFDHHQVSYEGPLSSAGMVLQWLAADARVDAELAGILRRQVVDYVDAVDNGRRRPDDDVPCFASQVAAYNHGCRTPADFDAAFLEAAGFAERYVRGLRNGLQQVREARGAVKAAMEAAVEAGSNVMELDAYYKWKPAYFELGGEDHPTEYALYPGMDGNWHVLAIPPELGDFAQKHPLPEAWAGLTGRHLVEVVGVPGARFCHKNRFIAVFEERDQALQALESHGRRWRHQLEG